MVADLDEELGLVARLLYFAPFCQARGVIPDLLQ
jgi:hypothetical protein